MFFNHAKVKKLNFDQSEFRTLLSASLGFHTETYPFVLLNALLLHNWIFIVRSSLLCNTRQSHTICTCTSMFGELCGGFPYFKAKLIMKYQKLCLKFGRIWYSLLNIKRYCYATFSRTYPSNMVVHGYNWNNMSFCKYP